MFKYLISIGVTIVVSQFCSAQSLEFTVPSAIYNSVALTCTYNVEWLEPEVEEGVTLTSTHVNGSEFPLGVTVVTYTASDNQGNTNSQSFSVIVDYFSLPAARCQDVTVFMDATGTATIQASDIDNESYDNCSELTLVISQNYFDQPGVYDVTLTAIDSYGNSSDCTSVVTVLDGIPPIAICQDVTLYLDQNGEASISPYDIDAGSIDNFVVAGMSLDQELFTVQDLGTNTVTLTVYDADQNSATCMATVVVLQESTEPLIPSVTNLPMMTGECSFTISDFPTAVDALGNVFIGTTPDLLFYDEQGTYVITWIYEDEQGNVITQDQLVEIEDTLEPEVPVCEDLFFSEPFTLNLPTAQDNCSGTITAITTDPLTYSEPGQYTVTWMFDDGNGNSSSCVQSCTFELNNEAPAAICQDIMVSLDNSGSVTVQAEDLDGGSYDQEGAITFISTQQEFDCLDLGSNSVGLTVTDLEGNTAVCVSTVTVEDAIEPILACPSDITVTLDANQEFIVPDYSSAMIASDNCFLEFILQNPAPGTVITEDIDVHIEVSDASGNTSTCSFHIQTEPYEEQGNPSSGIAVLEISFDFYPNPSEGLVNVFTDFDDEFLVTIFGISGNQVYKNEQTRNKTQIDLSDLSAGLYMLEVRLGDEVIVQKLMVN